MRASVLAVALALGATSAWAQADSTAGNPALSRLDGTAQKTANIPAGPLGRALAQWATSTGVALSFDPALTEGRTSPALVGNVSAREGFARLLAGSGLEMEAKVDGSFGLQRSVPTPVGQAPSGERALAQVTVKESAEVPGELPKPYAGGQVARGGRAGVLGNSDFMSTPFSVTAFTDEFKENLQARSLGDILKFNVSAQAPQTTVNPQNDVVNLRGFRDSSANGSINGLAGLFARVPPIEPFERFEVLLGASAFANGRPASVGGHINLVPKRANDLPLNRVGIHFESDSIIGTSVDVGRRFGKDNVFGLRINASHEEGNASVEDTPRRGTTASLAFDYRGDKLRFSLDLIHDNKKQRNVDSLGLGLGLAVPTAPNAEKLYTLRGTRYQQEFSLATTKLEWDFADQWTVSAAYGRSLADEYQTYTGYTIRDSVGTLQGTAGESRFRPERESSELLVRGRFDTGPISHRLSAGATRSSGEQRSLFGTSVPIPNSNLYNPINVNFPAVPPVVLPANPTSDFVTSGLFVGDEIGFLNDRLLLTLGARRVKLETTSYNGVSGLRTGGYEGSATTPAFGVLFKATPVLSLYANHVEALENGTLVTPPASNAGDILPPLKSKQIEVGAKADFGSFAATLAYFSIDKANQYRDTVSNVFVQNGLQRNRGLELSLFGEPHKGFRVFSALSLIDTEIKRSNGGTLDGKKAIAVPDYTLATNLEWDVRNIPGLTFYGGLIRTDATWLDSANSQRVPGWTRIDAGLRFASKISGRNAVFRLGIENLANKDYFMADGTVLYLAPPRTVLLSATVDF